MLRFFRTSNLPGLYGLVRYVKDQNRLIALRGAIELIHEISPVLNPRRPDRPNKNLFLR
jgi:hypothetical protein